MPDIAADVNDILRPLLRGKGKTEVVPRNFYVLCPFWAEDFYLGGII